ncbi:MAG: hypothetical protein LW878_10920 [Proteobacteria bacterium]|nr:hypothetical protein [Pseudomonadota bacterium]
MKALKKLKIKNPTLQRWSLKLQGYNYTLRYVPGHRIPHVDCLSRKPVKEEGTYFIYATRINSETGKRERVWSKTVEEGIAEEHATEKEKFIKAQQEEAWSAGQIADVMEKGSTVRTGGDLKILEWVLPVSDYMSWVVKNDGGLYVREGSYDSWKERMYVPQSYRLTVLRDAHEHGHFGIKRTYERVHRTFYWVGMKKDVEIFVKGCLCAGAKKMKGKKVATGDLKATRRGELVGINVLSGLPKTKDGYTKIIVMTDYVTKWVAVKAIKGEVTAAKTGEALVKRWILRGEGLMERLLSDNGPEFANEVWDAAVKYMELRKHSTTGHRPQCNGQVERMNQTIAEMLRVYCGEYPENWREYLDVMIYEYNCSPHPEAGESPFYMRRGREANTPFQFALNFDLEGNMRKKTEREKRFLRLVERVREALKRIDERKKARREREAKKTRIGRNTYKVGDRVWLRTWPRTVLEKGMTAKLAPKRSGPYEVIRVVNEQTIAVRIGDEDKLVNVANTSEYVERPEWMRDSEEELMDEENRFEGTEEMWDEDFNDKDYVEK